MPVIYDDEFGKVTVRRSSRSSSVRIRVAPDGTLRASLPLYTPVFFVKRLIKTSRSELRELIYDARPQVHYTDGMQIGKSHSLMVRHGSATTARRHGQQITITIPPDTDLAEPAIEQAIRTQVIAALRVEAKSYLPKRLAYIAQKNSFTYERVRFSHASGRWGSCSSTGTISLNIALMKLPFELIDYVIIHELAHTKQMNHSSAFWQLVAAHDPHYKVHRAALKAEQPSI